MIVMLAVVAAVVGALAFVKFRQVQAAMTQSWSAPPEAVTTIVVEASSWPATLRPSAAWPPARGTDLPDW
jgi:hypothetical protein